MGAPTTAAARTSGPGTTSADATASAGQRWRVVTSVSCGAILKFARNSHPIAHLGTLGTGNHFIEVCLDESDRVWIMLHSGSRGVGNRIGTYFIELAKKDLRQLIGNLPDRDLAYLEEGTEHFNEYVDAVGLGAELRADESRTHDGGDP